MPDANINDRSSVERAYPRQDFERDTAHNARGDAEVLRGVRITSEPDGSGTFTLAAAARHVGEVAPDADTAFLVPHRTNEATIGFEAERGYGGEKEVAAPDPGVRPDDYAAFIDSIIELARGVDFQDAIGRGEERLAGFRGG